MNIKPELHRTYRFIGCEIVYREACYLAARSPHRIDVEFLRKALHDLETQDMVARIQQAIDAVEEDETDYDAILLGYARCNDGLVGVQARQTPLVIPRAHDCITLFFGSRQAYQAYFDAHPGTYFMTTGWAERNSASDGSMLTGAYGKDGVMKRLGLDESYDQLVAKHGKDNADYIIEMMGGWEKAYDTMLFLEMGVCDESAFVDSARQEAQQRGWTFDQQPGNLSLLEKLFAGPWDDDFVIVSPGEKIVPRNDASVLAAEPVDAEPSLNGKGHDDDSQ